MKFVVLSIFLMLTSCKGGPFVPLGSPLSWKLLHNAPDGPQNFQIGWRDGCKSGITGSESDFYRTLSGVQFTRNYTLAKQDPDYGTGWELAFWYCNRYMERYHGLDDGSYGGIL